MLLSFGEANKYVDLEILRDSWQQREIQKGD